MACRKHELNLDPDFDPLDPAQVSDPSCWITGEAAEVLKRGMVEKIGMLRRAPLLPAPDPDLSKGIVFDSESGKYRQRETLP
jgi:hypothetical protein